MKSYMRKGYENYEQELERSLDILRDYIGEEVERRTDGSFYALSVKTKNTVLNSIRVYHEFIEQQLIVTVQIGNEFITTLELNKNLRLFEDEELKPRGDDYIEALQRNFLVIKQVITGSFGQ